jgi:uncharacterized lipoprotein YmbA
MRTLSVVAMLCTALAGGCSSTPPTNFYTLSSTAVAASTTAKQSVAVGPVLIPALVDRPQMVLSAGANQVSIDEFNRWAAPLADEITRVTVGNLTQLLGNADVWPDTAGGASRADVKLRIDILRFETRPGEAVLIDARWTLRRGADTSAGRSQLREPTRGTDAEAFAAAFSRALQRMAADIATAIRAP